MASDKNIPGKEIDLRKLGINPLKKRGKVNMRIGFLIFLGGVIFTIISYLLASTSKGGVFIICRGAIVWGGIQFVIGIAQYFSTSDAQELEVLKANKALYGVEEPERTWECPRCQATNPNTTYVCKKCGMRLG